MKQQVSPIAAIVAIVVVLGLTVFAWLRLDRGGGEPGEKRQAGMPPAVAAEFQRRMGGIAPGGATAPGSQQAQGGPMIPGGRPTTTSN